MVEGIKTIIAELKLIQAHTATRELAASKFQFRVTDDLERFKVDTQTQSKAVSVAINTVHEKHTDKREELQKDIEKRIPIDIKACEEKLQALVETTRTELDRTIIDHFARGAKKIKDDLREEIEMGVKLVKKEVAAVLHISGKYDMELKPDLARSRGYSRTLGEHIAKVDRAN